MDHRLKVKLLMDQTDAAGAIGALQTVAAAIEAGRIPEGTDEELRDAQGNVIGFWSWD